MSPHRGDAGHTIAGDEGDHHHPLDLAGAVGRARHPDRSGINSRLVDQLRRSALDDVADDPAAGPDLARHDRVRDLPLSEDRPEGLAVRLSDPEGHRINGEKRPDALADPIEHGLDVERCRDLLADLGERRHLIAAPVCLLVQPGVLDRDPDVGCDRRQESCVGLAESAFLGRVLDADHADRRVAGHDRHAEIRLRLDPEMAAAHVGEVGLAIEQERRLCSQHLRGQALAEGDRLGLAPDTDLEVVREPNQAGGDVVERHVADVRIERPPHLLADELEQRLQIELARQRLADLVDRRELGEALPGLVDQANVFQGDAEARGQGDQEPDVGLREHVFLVEVLE